MGLFSRPEPKIVRKVERRDVFVRTVGPDGKMHGSCWFCNAPIAYAPEHETGEFAVMMVEPIGTGEPIHGLCHRACIEAAKGSRADQSSASTINTSST